MFRAILISSALALTACGTYQAVAPIDASTGLLPTSAKATMITAEKMDLDTRKDLLVFVGENKFAIDQAKAIGFFDEVVGKEALEAAIIKADLVDEVPTVEGLIGMNNAAKKYKPFLYMDFDSRTEGANQYLQLVLTDAVSMTEVFRAERRLDTIWEGVNDRNTFYPLYNALIEYIKDNSSTYSAPTAPAMPE